MEIFLSFGSHMVRLSELYEEITQVKNKFAAKTNLAVSSKGLCQCKFDESNVNEGGTLT